MPPPSASTWPTWGVQQLGLPVFQAFVVSEDVHWLDSYPTGPLMEASHNGVALLLPRALVPLGAGQLTAKKVDRVHLPLNAFFGAVLIDLVEGGPDGVV